MPSPPNMESQEATGRSHKKTNKQDGLKKESKAQLHKIVSQSKLLHINFKTKNVATNINIAYVK